ncbi:MAG: Asp-tRNA(Asn)/Glu-tRNA(Gln) amidotransferase subunit GatB [Patescibacteria group bacterium]|nr:Asp-tRNA(Asn)/Glu-tRNA(Gln) amidotransferase subunit GatB [Patescibacteria group bacterium]
MTYQPIIGIEIHVQLKTASKMFCGCKNYPFGAKKPNFYTCPVCLGLPGALPVPNKKAIEWTIALGLALKCQINSLSKFDRKHYFYPDLPKGYQISQYDSPFCFNGKVTTSQGEVSIRRIHLEEDTGKLIHASVNGKKVTLIDFNRSGVPLIEIVSEPQIHSPAQAKECAKKIFQIIRYLNLSDADMEKGQLRLEANVSLRPKNRQDLPNYKVELKNINSFRFLEKAIETEIKRQTEILLQGKTPVQETRGYNAEKNLTYPQRSKEEAADYRYFPEPDIPPIRISSQWLESIKNSLPLDYETLLASWEKSYRVEKHLVSLLFDTHHQAAWLEKLFQKAKRLGIEVRRLVNFLANKKIKVNLFAHEEPQKILDLFHEQTQTISIEVEELERAIDQVIKHNPQAVADFRKGKKNVLNFLLGQTLKLLGKKVDPKQIIKLINEKIS